MASDYFCDPKTTPPDLLAAVPESTTLRAWAKQASDADLSRALDCIYVHHQHHRQVIQDEIAARQQAETKARSGRSFAQAERHHRDRQWWTRFSAWVAFLSALVALASFLAGRFLPPPQDRELARRVTALEQQMSVAAATPRPTAAPTQQTQSQSTSSPAVSGSTPAQQATP
jgi:hypothetical protein